MLVLGTGGVSIVALQLAKAMGARVAATSSSPQTLERLRALGADHVVNDRRDARWGETVRAWTGRCGVDHVVEVGGPATLPQSIAACRIGGHIALIGVLTARGGEIPIALLMARQQRLQGLLAGAGGIRASSVHALNATGIRSVLDRSFSLDTLADAFRHEETGPTQARSPGILKRLRAANDPVPASAARALSGIA